MNWAFTQPGRYTYTMSATVNVDGTPQTAAQEFVFYIGDNSPAQAEARLTATDANATTGRPVTLQASVSSGQFEFAQGWVQFEQEESGDILGYAKLVEGSAALELSGFPSPGRKTIRATYMPRYEEDAKSVSNTFMVDVSGVALPAALRSVNEIEDLPQGVSSVDTIDSRKSVATIHMADSSLADKAVFVDVLTAVPSNRHSDVPVFQRSVGSRWLRTGSDLSLIVPLPAMPGTYHLVIRNHEGVQIGSTDLQVPTISGDETYVPEIPDNSQAATGGGDFPNSQSKGNHEGSKGDMGQASIGELPVQLCTSADMLVLDHGHIDIAAFSPHANTLQMVIQEDVTGNHVRRNPASVMLWLKASARTSRGWSVPQTQKQDLLWLGWNNQYLSSREVPVKWTLDALEGPGSMRIWTQGNLGAADTTILDSNGSRTFAMPANTHTHANWDFSAEGYYKLTMTYSSTLGSDTKVIYVTVGDKDPKAMPISCSNLQKENQGLIATPPAVNAASKDRESSLKKKTGQSRKINKKSIKNDPGGVRDADDLTEESAAGMFASHPVLSALVFSVAGASLASVATAAPFLLKRRGLHL